MKLNLEEKLERERMENVMEKMSLEEQVVKLLKEKNLKVSTTESCTGGFLAGTIVNVSGASSVFDEGYITYSNEAKQKILGVKAETLEQYGAVSEETAREMAQGCAKKAEVDIAVGITGIAGPTGGTEEKPVGLVYMGCYYKNEAKVKKFIFSGDRLQVRQQSVEEALKFILERLEE